MPDRLRHLVGRALLFLPFIAVPAHAADPWINLALNDAGEVHLQPHTLAPSDYVMAVYAERLEDVPVPAAARPAAPGPLPRGCLPVVSIGTASGLDQFAHPAELSFGCTDLPANARIHVWRNGAWRAVPTHRLPDGRLHTEFTQAAVYGVFLVDNTPRI